MIVRLPGAQNVPGWLVCVIAGAVTVGVLMVVVLASFGGEEEKCFSERIHYTCNNFPFFAN